MSEKKNFMIKNCKKLADETEKYRFVQTFF